MKRDLNWKLGWGKLFWREIWIWEFWDLKYFLFVVVGCPWVWRRTRRSRWLLLWQVVEVRSKSWEIFCRTYIVDQQNTYSNVAGYFEAALKKLERVTCEKMPDEICCFRSSGVGWTSWLQVGFEPQLLRKKPCGYQRLTDWAIGAGIKNVKFFWI